MIMKFEAVDSDPNLNACLIWNGAMDGFGATAAKYYMCTYENRQQTKEFSCTLFSNDKFRLPGSSRQFRSAEVFSSEFHEALLKGPDLLHRFRKRAVYQNALWREFYLTSHISHTFRGNRELSDFELTS